MGKAKSSNRPRLIDRRKLRRNGENADGKLLLKQFLEITDRRIKAVEFS